MKNTTTTTTTAAIRAEQARIVEAARLAWGHARTAQDFAAAAAASVVADPHGSETVTDAATEAAEYAAQAVYYALAATRDTREVVRASSEEEAVLIREHAEDACWLANEHARHCDNLAWVARQFNYID